MAILTVTTTADSGAGSLRAAIASAASGDTIRFASNLANKTIALTTGNIRITQNITIDGSSAPNLKVSGSNRSRIFQIEKFLNVTIRNLSLNNGRSVVEGTAVGEGGAVQVRDYGNLIVENSKFSRNVAERGGAIRVGFGGSLTVRNSSFDSNDGSIANDNFSAGAIATYGAGGATGKGRVVVENSRFTNNKGVTGGAIYNLLGPLSIKNSVFKTNQSLLQGGAVFTDGASGSNRGDAPGQIVIESSSFDGNKASAGGGALFLWTYRNDAVSIKDSTIINNSVARGGRYNQGRGGGVEFATSNLTIENTTIANNVSAVQGGGLWVDNNVSSVNISNSTISNNQALADAGGGMFLSSPDGVPVRITNTTIVGNLAGRDAGGIWSNGTNSDDITLTNTILAKNSAIQTKQGHTNRTLKDGGGNIIESIPGGRGPKVTANSLYVTDMKLGALQFIGNDVVHPLLIGSPAINAGVNLNVPLVDQRGLRRDVKTDSGAFEFGAVATSTPSSATRAARISNLSSRRAGHDTLTGTSRSDTLSGAAGNHVVADFSYEIGRGRRAQPASPSQFHSRIKQCRNHVLMGLGAADGLTGGAGADRFTYSSNSQTATFSQSTAAATDRITNFNVQQGDRIQFNFDQNLTSSHRPSALFNTGQVVGASLTQAVSAAFADKNAQISGSQTLPANEAVMFQNG